MDKQQIKDLALKNGFKLKEQPNGDYDLNPYVYDFAYALIMEVSGQPQPPTRQEVAFQRWCD